MVWLIGNRGMLGHDVELELKNNSIDYCASDLDVDITDYRELNNFACNRAKDENINWIVNCAAYTAVDKAEDEKDLAFRINSEGVLNIARLAKERNAGLIHISTDYVFDGEEANGYTEEANPNPVSVYGKSKLAGEINVRETCLKYFIIRTTWLYGKHGKNFVHTMLRLFKQKDDVKVVNDQFGSPTYTRDLAKAILKMIESDLGDYGIYHFSGEGKTSWFHFAGQIYRLSKEKGLINRDVKLLPVATKEYPVEAQRPKNSYLLKTKIKKTFNIPVRHWKDGLVDFLKEIEADG